MTQAVFLEWQGNQITEPTLGHRILIGKQTIVGVETNLMPLFDGSGQQNTTKFACLGSRDRRVEEDPDVATVPRPGSLQCGGHSQLLARLQVLRNILLPVHLVKVGREEPAGFIS